MIGRDSTLDKDWGLSKLSYSEEVGEEATATGCRDSRV